VTPQDLIPTFLTTAWDSKLFYCVKCDDYPWYLRVPYIHLLMHYRESIDLTIMLEPPPPILEEVYSTQVHTINGKEQFYSINKPSKKTTPSCHSNINI